MNKTNNQNRTRDMETENRLTAAGGEGGGTYPKNPKTPVPKDLPSP